MARVRWLTFSPSDQAAPLAPVLLAIFWSVSDMTSIAEFVVLGGDVYVASMEGRGYS
jgi:hypothetical protein